MNNNIHKYTYVFKDKSIITLVFNLDEETPRIKCLPPNTVIGDNNVREYDTWLFRVVLPDIMDRLSVEQITALSNLALKDLFKT